MPPDAQVSHPEPKALKGAVVRFAGDSGDGMQVTGTQFTATSALIGNDLATFPDFPAEIRAPTGTLYGVSGFQVHFSADNIFTPGDEPDALVAMNPAALKTNLGDVKPGGLVIVNTDAFNSGNLKKANYDSNPLEDGTLAGYHVIPIDISKHTLAAVAEVGLSTKEANRCKNFWTLGLMYWLYNRPRDTTVRWLEAKFKKRPEVVRANTLALNAGHAFGETLDLSHERYVVPKAKLEPGKYRNISGNLATAWGFVAASQLSGLDVILGSYPITPASDVLHELSQHKHLGITTVQAEDEIAAVCVAVGASYAGRLGVTSTSGPGMALKAEALGLAVAVELPLVVLNVQRAGPSTGMPTKTEQADLMQAMYGRNGESPVAVLAASTPGDCFFAVIEAARIAVKYMTPVVLLTDGYLGNGAEPWRIPSDADLEALRFQPTFAKPSPEFHPYLRDPKTLARNWAVPGAAGLMHRVGGLEKAYDSGNISYDPANHQKMSEVRAAKIQRIADEVAEQSIDTGDASGDLLVLGWGSTYGAIREAVQQCRASGMNVSHAHLRYLNPFPRNLGQVLANFKRVVIPEMNMGQLVRMIRSTYMIDAQSYAKIEGKPFKVSELKLRIARELEAIKS